MSREMLRIEAELRRLHSGAREHLTLPTAGLARLVATCPCGPLEVRSNATAVLVSLNEHHCGTFSTSRVPTGVLPDWFVSQCAPELSSEQAERQLAEWKSLSPAEQVAHGRTVKWALDDWLYWMDPVRRQWYWWDAKAADHRDLLIVSVEVETLPFPWGALDWLLRASGASSTELVSSTMTGKV